MGQRGPASLGAPSPQAPQPCLGPSSQLVGLSRDMLESQVLHQRPEHGTLQDS